MSGLASASGAQPPEHSVSVVPAPSSSGLTWAFEATTTAAPLATAWAAATAYTAGQVVKRRGKFYRCTTSGTSGGSGPSGVGADLQDGSAVWRGVGPIVNGMLIQNIEAGGGTAAYLGFDEADATQGIVIPAGVGFVSLSANDPTRIYVVTASGSAELRIAGLS